MTRLLTDAICGKLLEQMLKESNMCLGDDERHRERLCLWPKTLPTNMKVWIVKDNNTQLATTVNSAVFE